MNKLPKWGILKYLSAQKSNNVKRLNAPGDQKRLRYNVEMIFKQNLTNDSYRQIGKDSETNAGVQNGFHCGKWPKYPFVRLYAKKKNLE